MYKADFSSQNIFLHTSIYKLSNRSYSTNSQKQDTTICMYFGRINN